MAELIVHIMCPNLRCRSVLGVPQEARGRMVRCRHCGTKIRVPKQAKAVTAPDELPAESGKGKSKA